MAKSEKPKIDNWGVPTETPIYRFVDLPRLFDLLGQRNLFFPAISTLMKGDPYECIRPINSDGMSESALRHEANELWEVAVPFQNSKRLRPASDDVCKKEYLELIAELEVPELRKLVSYLRRNDVAKNMVCSCWHISDEESDAMWKIYCQQNGVAIRSTVGRLQDSLRFPEPHNPFHDSDTFEVAKVVYLNHNETIPQHFGERPWLIKRRAFEHEKELRICYRQACRWAPEGALIPANVQRLVQEIIVTPFLPNWGQTSVAAAIADVLAKRGLKKIRVKISEHMNAPDELEKIINKRVYDFYESSKRVRRPEGLAANLVGE